MKKLALLVMAAFSASLIFACSSDPEVVEVVKEVIVEKEVEKIVEVPVEKIVTKIVTESVPQPVGYMMEAPENVTNTGGTLKTAFGVTMGHFDAHQRTTSNETPTPRIYIYIYIYIYNSIYIYIYILIILSNI